MGSLTGRLRSPLAFDHEVGAVFVGVEKRPYRKALSPRERARRGQQLISKPEAGNGYSRELARCNRRDGRADQLKLVLEGRRCQSRIERRVAYLFHRSSLRRMTKRRTGCGRRER
jgi:hypothetical protein